MKKILFVVLAVGCLMVASFAPLALSADVKDAKGVHDMHNMQADKPVIEKDIPAVPMKSMMDGKECMMMKHMKGAMNMSMSVLPDGSIVVLAGNRLIKYDEDLNLVREVEIKMEMEGKHKQLKEKMKNYPKMVPDTKNDSLPEMDMQDEAN